MALPTIPAHCDGIPIRLDEPRHRDLLVCGISTQLHQEVVGLDQRIGPSDGDFVTSGLGAESVIRLGYLAALPRTLATGAMGAVSRGRHRGLLHTLSRYLDR